jgi:hypothetical protein
VRFEEIVIGEMKRNRRIEIFQLFAERQGKARQSLANASSK